MKPLKNIIIDFFFPRLNKKSALRIVLLIFVAYITFSFVFIPYWVQGKSMEPTFRDGGFNFCFGLKYKLFKINRHDIVFIRFAGKKIMLLKRVLAFPGETLSFINGSLMINNQVIDEPYVSFPCDWNIDPVVVKANHLFVMGDNRNMPKERHDYGQTHQKRIIGGPIW